MPLITNRRANKKLDHITYLTNSNLSAANARIASLEKLIEQLLIEKGSRPE